MKKRQPPSSHLPSERVIAFIDILGFRNLIDRMSSDHKIYLAVKHALRKISEGQRKQKRFAKHHDFGRELEQAHFSDCIVLSWDATDRESPDPALTILLLASIAAGDLLKDGIFVRGGIAQGWVFHRSNVLFGEGMITAYDLSNRVARVPRIVIDDELVENMDQYTKEFHLKRDSDGVWFINIFKELYTDYFPNKPDHKLFEKVRAFIQSGLEKARAGRDVHLVPKYRWLAGQFNEELDYTGIQQIERISLD